MRVSGSNTRAVGWVSPRIGLRDTACCRLPENSLTLINPTNPSSWYKEISNLSSGLLGTAACTENEIFNGTANASPSFNPQDAIQRKFQALAALGRMYTLLPAIVSLTEENKKAEKDQHNLALAA